MSVYELARQEDFGNMSLIVEDFAKDNGANHSGKQVISLIVHEVVKWFSTGESHVTRQSACQSSLYWSISLPL